MCDRQGAQWCPLTFKYQRNMNFRLPTHTCVQNLKKIIKNKEGRKKKGKKKENIWLTNVWFELIFRQPSQAGQFVRTQMAKRIVGSIWHQHSHRSSEANKLFTSEFSTSCGTFHSLPRAKKIQVCFLCIYRQLYKFLALSMAY